jgi:8-oxo-dGTP pyrophosphatase MutT (NUDIX family)
MSTGKGNLVLCVAAKAVIVNAQGQVLVVRESSKHKTNTKAGRYSLPGGRIEPGEAFFDGLHREVQEETGLAVDVHAPLLAGEWRPVILGVPHQIIGMFMHCTPKGSTTARLSEEHDDAQWINLADRASYNIVTPDCDAIEAHVASLSSAA